MTNRIGDRPRFPLSNQRFDKGDAENIARYYEEIISRFTGSIYGQAWGFMSNPGFYMESAVVGVQTFNYIKLNKCVLLHSVPVDGTDNFQFDDKGPWDATIVVYDPTKSSQTLQALTTNTAFSASQRPWILFRRSEAPTNFGNKAYWNTSSNTEDIDAAPLQDSEYVEFRLSTVYSTTDRNAGWHRCAYIDSWGTPGSAATPVIVPVHWMDSLFYNQTNPPVQGTRVGMALSHPSVPADEYETGFSPTREMPELAKLMHWIAGKLGQHYSTTNVQQLSGTQASLRNLKDGAFIARNDGEGSWLSTPERGLRELHTDLATAEQDIVDLKAVDLSLVQSIGVLMSRIMKTYRVLCSLYVTPVYDGGSWSDTTFTVVLASDVNSTDSFSPDVRQISVGPPLLANDLVYDFVPVTASDTAGVQLTLSIGSNFEIGSVSVVPHGEVNTALGSSLAVTVTQNYGTASGITLPPGRFIRTQFAVRSASEGATLGKDLSRPFTVHIYGRNI